MPASRVIRLSLLLSALVVVLDLLITHRLSLVFGLAFPLICVAAAIAVRPRDFFAIGVLPPILMFAVMLVVSATNRTAIAQASDGVAQGVITGLAEHAVSLLVGYALCLAVLGVRQEFLRRQAGPDQHPATAAPSAPKPAPAATVVVPVPVAAANQANLSGSPAPTLSTSGEPDEKSTTVVGNDPHSPQSRTASTW